MSATICNGDIMHYAFAGFHYFESETDQMVLILSAV